MDDKKDEQRKKTWTEEIEVAGGELIERMKALLAEGRVRQVRVKAPGGEVYFETPLTVGVLAGGAVALAAPWLAILGAIAALVARVKIEIVREGEPGEAVKAPGAKAPGAKAAKKPAAKAKRAATRAAGRGKVKSPRTPG